MKAALRQNVGSALIRITTAPFFKQRASAMVIAVLLVTVLTIMGASYLDLIGSGSIGTKLMETMPQAFYAAEAGVYRLLDQMNSGGATSVTGSLANNSNTASYTASYNASTGIITSAGSVTTNIATATRTVTVRTRAVPPYVRGAISVNGQATIKDEGVCDGRDHDSNGNLTGDPGTYGLSSTAAVEQLGNAKIGGNDIAPANPANSSTYQAHASAFSSTNPWDLIGVSESWFNSNVTATTTAPTVPWSGIKYYSPSGDWDDANLDGSSGILIAHNSTGTARIRNMYGTFKGLIIADKFRQENSGSATIIGAVDVLSVLQDKGGNMNINYSSSILSGLASVVSNQTSAWKKTIMKGSWQESK